MKMFMLLVLVLLVLPVKPACQPVKRNPTVVRHFMKMTGYPHGRRGYIVDHIVPLCACGADTVNNMQWQTITDASVKDALERKQCRELRNNNK